MPVLDVRDGTPRAVAVQEPLLGDSRPDYADAFEIRTPEPDGRTAEQWARAALEQAPWPVRRVVLVAHRYVLRFRLGPLPSPDHVLGWRIEMSEPEVIRLQAESPLVRAVIVGRRPEPTRTVLTTALFFVRPMAARVIWAAVVPVHRRVACYLLARAASAG
jgi:hypothetical protein